MSISFIHSKGADAPIAIPAIGLDLIVHTSPSASGGAFSIIETVNAPGKGPPRHKHTEASAFFTELAEMMRNGAPDKAALNHFGAKWRVESLGPPLTLADQPTT
jgi:hypothetical protein